MGMEKHAEPSIGYPKPLDPTTPDGKAESIFRHASKKLFEDCTGICFFATVGVPQIGQWLPQALSRAIGWDIDWAQCLQVGERVVQLQRVIAVQRGFRKANDFEISERMLVDAGTGPAAGRVLKPHLERMMDEYYTLCGWDLESGAPRAETLARLHMNHDLVMPHAA